MLYVYLTRFHSEPYIHLHAFLMKLYGTHGFSFVSLKSRCPRQIANQAAGASTDNNRENENAKIIDQLRFCLSNRKLVIRSLSVT